MAEEERLGIEIFVDDEESSMSHDQHLKIFKESFDLEFPSASIIFTDYLSYYTSYRPLMQATSIKYNIVKGDNSFDYDFYPSENAMLHNKTLEQPQYEYSLNLVSKKAKEIYGYTEFHSKRCKASDYVKYIARSIGVDFDIEDTSGIKNWINPNWSYYMMLKYLASHSVSANGRSGYYFTLNKDNVLVFKTIDKFFEESRDNEIDILLDYGAVVSGGNVVDIRNNLFITTLLGQNNMNLFYYDLDKGEYNSKNVKYSDYIFKNAEKYGVSNDIMNFGVKHYLGEYDSDVVDTPYLMTKDIYVKALLSKENTVINLTMSERFFDIGLGDVVNIKFPVAFSKEIDFNFSGKYLVKENALKGYENFYQVLTLVRTGYNITPDNYV